MPHRATAALLAGLVVSACAAAPPNSASATPPTPPPTQSSEPSEPAHVATAVDADFYEPPASLGDAEPGDVIRSEEIFSPISDMRLWTVLYRSVGIDGEPIAVSGVIATPAATSDGPHAYLSWAH